MLKSFIKVREAVLGVFNNEDGASLAEYALIIALVLIGAGAALTLLTGAVSGALSTGTECLNGTLATCKV